MTGELAEGAHIGLEGIPGNLLEEYGPPTSPETMRELDGIADYILSCISLDRRVENNGGCLGLLGNLLSGRFQRAMVVFRELGDQVSRDKWRAGNIVLNEENSQEEPVTGANFEDARTVLDSTTSYLPLPSDGTNGVATLPRQIEAWWIKQGELSRIDSEIDGELARLVERPTRGEKRLIGELREMRANFAYFTNAGLNGGEIGAIKAKASLLTNGFGEKMKEIRADLLGTILDLQQERGRTIYDLAGEIDCKLTTAVSARVLEKLGYDVKVYYCKSVGAFFGLHPRLLVSNGNGSRKEIHFGGSSEGTVAEWKDCGEYYDLAKEEMRRGSDDDSGVDMDVDWVAWQKIDLKFLRYVQEHIPQFEE